MGTIGEKRTRIRIEQRVETADGQGGKDVSYTTRCTVWANDRPVNGRDALQATQVTATLSGVWEIWFRDDLSVTDRIISGSRTVQIENMYDPDGLRRELYLLCSEVQA